MHIMLKVVVKSSPQILADDVVPACEVMWAALTDSDESVTVRVQFDKLDPGLGGTTEQVHRSCYWVTLAESRYKRSMLRCLAHELVHVRQMLTGELEPLIGGFRWRGEEIFDDSERFYWLRAEWEIEARGLADGLIALYYRQI
jgi:hypothetical protein